MALLTDEPRPFTKDTIARWLRITMQMAGINTEVFKAHSIRGASTSKCHSLHVPVETILKHARWTNATIFAKYYKKTVWKTSFSVLCCLMLSLNEQSKSLRL